MKKSLLAFAALASLAGVASAQSSVTVYGLVDAGVTREIGGATGSITKLATGVQSGNRLGFKGSEDLGSGLKANFQIESGFNLDDGTGRQGALFGRQAYVGLSGNFGAVNLGRQNKPLFLALDSIDPFGTGLPGQTLNLMNLGGNGNNRANNAITYSTPDFSGFSANALYSAGEKANDASLSSTLGLSANYVNGPVLVTLAYEKANENIVDSYTKLVLLGGTYNFGPITAHAAYETDKSDALGTDYRDLMVGVSLPVGAGTVMASYIKKTDRTTAQSGAKQFGIGYTYALSKRTNLYTSYARINNETNSTAYVGDASSGGSAPIAGQASSAVTVGVRHRF